MITLYQPTTREWRVLAPTATGYDWHIVASDGRHTLDAPEPMSASTADATVRGYCEGLGFVAYHWPDAPDADDGKGPPRA